MPFELQPHLRGERLGLRPLVEADFEELFAAAADPLIWKQHPEPDRGEEPRFRQYFRGAIESGGAFAIIDRSSGRIIGSSRYFGYDETASEIEIGWTFLTRRYWGGSYNAELKRLMVEHALQYVERVVFLVAPQNIRSQRAMEKIGGRRVASRFRDGRESVVFEITAADYRRTDFPLKRSAWEAEATL